MRGRQSANLNSSWRDIRSAHSSISFAPRLIVDVIGTQGHIPGTCSRCTYFLTQLNHAQTKYVLDA